MHDVAKGERDLKGGKRDPVGWRNPWGPYDTLGIIDARAYWTPETRVQFFTGGVFPLTVEEVPPPVVEPPPVAALIEYVMRLTVMKPVEHTWLITATRIDGEPPPRTDAP